MICPEMMNNVEYRWIKTHKLFGFDQKSWIKTNNNYIFYLIMSKSEKCLKDNQKCLKAHYSTLFDSIQHYSTVFNIIRQYSTLFDFKKSIRFSCQRNKLTWFNLICVPNTKTNVVFFQIFIFNWIICPNLHGTVSVQPHLNFC